MLAFNRNRLVRFFRISRALWVALILAALGTQSAVAQYGMPGGMPYVPKSKRTNNPNSNPNSTLNRTPSQFQGTATITAIRERGLEVIDSTGNNWQLAPEKNCVTLVTGTAEPSFLKPDMLVRFVAQFDKKGNATAPLDELEIVSQQAALSSPKQEVAGKTAGTSGAIVGHIKSIKNNQLTVQTTNGTYAAELGPNASIKVSVSDFHWAQVGDKVDAVGYYSQPGIAYAQQMKIALSNPLGESGKKKPATKATGNSGTANK
jgi:hypothetical protein